MRLTSNTMIDIPALSGINIDFGAYVDKMRRNDEAHRVNGIPDYAFSLDYKLREEIRKIPFFYSLSKRVAVQAEARQRQLLTAGAVLAGPNQFADLYDMTQDCAKRLGIGSPNLYILNNQALNAFTYASDTVTPTIVLYSGIVERMTPGELKCVIGHECGHVHNEHSVYMSIVDLLNGVFGSVGTLAQFLSASTVLLYRQWSRAAEITCDRAGMICADRVEDAISVNKKLAYGTFINREETLDLEDLRRQLDELSQTASVFTEVGSTHPASIRRVLASDAFSRCELLYEWRPELKKPGMVLETKEEVDAKCAKITALFKEQQGR